MKYITKRHMQIIIFRTFILEFSGHYLPLVTKIRSPKLWLFVKTYHLIGTRSLLSLLLNWIYPWDFQITNPHLLWFWCQISHYLVNFSNSSNNIPFDMIFTLTFPIVFCICGDKFFSIFLLHYVDSNLSEFIES